MEAEMNVDNQGDQLKTKASTSSVAQAYRSSTCGGDQKEVERGELSRTRSASTFQNSETQECSTNQVEVFISDTTELAVDLNTPVLLPVDGGHSSTMPGSPHSGDLPAVLDNLPQVVPGKKRLKKGRSGKKNAGKEQCEKEQFQVGASQNVVADTRTNPQEPQRSTHEPELGQEASDLVGRRTAEGHAISFKSSSEGLHQSTVHAGAPSSVQSDLLVDVKHTAESSNFRKEPSLGRWADISEDSDNRANDVDLGRSQIENIKVDIRRTRKEDEFRGKGQQGRQAASPASRELDWRRKTSESKAKQEPSRFTNKPGDNKKDGPQDFRARVQLGAEAQATHKNWVARRGLPRPDSEGRAERSKIRGKGKQNRETESQQNQISIDFARQKFEADLKIKQEELLQRSKQSLKAEFQKAKRIEQLSKGRDELEEVLNNYLHYDDDGGLFFTVPKRNS